MADIESLLKEKRVFEPPKEFAKRANWSKKAGRGVPQARRAQSRALLGADGEAARLVVPALEEGAPVEAAACKVVRRRADQRRVQLPRSTSHRREFLAPQQGRDHLGGRARRLRACSHLRPAPPRSLQVRERAARPRRAEGRPRRDLPAVDPRSRAIAMLACAAHRAPHSVVFGGFSAESLRDRILDVGREGRHHRGRR